jgi:hypothetical protein
MPLGEWTFFARLHPESMPLSMQRQSFNATFDLLRLGYVATIDIAQSQVIAHIKLTNGDPDISTLRNAVETTIRGSTDLIGYLFGGSFDVEMISARNMISGDTIVFGITIPILRSRRDGQPILPSEMFVAVSASAETQAVLAYFREAIRSPIDTGFFCYRAIEGMLHSVVQIRKQATGTHWRQFRDTLNVAQSALNYVKQHSDLPRHGRLSAITDEQRAQVFSITDEVIRRYLYWLVHNRSSLNKIDFEVLEAGAPTIRPPLSPAGRSG